MKKRSAVMKGTIRVTELVKKTEDAIGLTGYPVGGPMRIRIHYDPVAETCGIVVDAAGSSDEYGNAKLYVPCSSIRWLGAAWSPMAYKVAFIMEYRTAAVMNKAAKLLSGHYGVPFVYENRNPYAAYLLNTLFAYKKEGEAWKKDLEKCDKMRSRFMDDFPGAAGRLDACRKENKTYAEEYFLVCRDISEMERNTARLYSNIACAKERFVSEKEYNAAKQYWQKISSTVEKLNAAPRIVNVRYRGRTDRSGTDKRMPDPGYMRIFTRPFSLSIPKVRGTGNK